MLIASTALGQKTAFTSTSTTLVSGTCNDLQIIGIFGQAFTGTYNCSGTTVVVGNPPPGSPMTTSDGQTNIFSETKIFPNPVSGLLRIDLETAYSAQSVKVQIYGIDGSILFNQVYSNPQYTLDVDLENLNNGIYLLQLSNEKQESRHFKIIKQQ